MTRSLATCAGLAITAALVTGRWELVAFAAPLLGVLCSLPWQRPVPTVDVYGSPPFQRCFEDEEVRVGISADADDGSAVELDRTDVVVRETRWGRYSIRASVRVNGRGGLHAGTGSVDAAEVCVFPVAAPQSTAIPRTDLLDRLGTHLTRHTGPGVEFADIRPYVPGDQLRSVNWPVSARRGALHVTERLTDRAADIVVLLDMYPQPPGPATSATERTARGAAQVVQSALRYGDRAGLVVLGERRIRWLGADIGQRQFYRILDTMLGSAGTFETATGTLAPRPALPTGAIVIAFSTLLDTEFALALIDMRKRGHPVVAVDVLEGSPIDGDHDPLVHRMWAMQR